jgi:predicted permease
VSPGRAAYPADRIAPYVERMREALSAIPGVERVSPVQTRPLSGGGNNGRVNIPGQPWDDNHRSNLNRVGDGLFETLRMPILSGRPIERRDLAPGATAVVVDQAFAHKYFPRGNAIGQRFGMDPKRSDQFEIVGIAANSLYNNLRADPYPTVYQPYQPGGTVHFAIRSTLDATGLSEAVRRAVASVDPAVPLVEFHTQTGLIDRLLRTERLLGFVSGAFGLVAVTLAAIGLGALLAYAVARRTNEIGVRMALGAAAGDVVRMVIRDSLRLVAAGVAIGLPCAYAMGRMLRTALFRLEPLDPQSAAAAAMALLAVALLAAWIPARRASRIDPIAALRQE